MSVEAITDAIHEYMFEKLNDSPETEEEEKIRYVNKTKNKNHERTTRKTGKIQENWLQPLRRTELVTTTRMSP